MLAFHSTLGRHGAPSAPPSGDTTIFNKPELPKGTIENVGFHEAPRGTLSHWVVEDGVIKELPGRRPHHLERQPPRHQRHLGPHEASLLQNPIADPEHPLEVLRTIHSFDPAWPAQSTCSTRPETTSRA